MCSKWSVPFAGTSLQASTMEYSPVRAASLSSSAAFAVTSATLAGLRVIAPLISITAISASIVG